MSLAIASWALLSGRFEEVGEPCVVCIFANHRKLNPVAIGVLTEVADFAA